MIRSGHRHPRRSFSGTVFAPVEAAACGIPVVAFDAGGVHDWIEDGINGLLVPPADPLALAQAIAGLVTHPERMRHMGEAARRKALETSWSAVADRYAEFTLSTIATPSNRN